MNPLVSGDQDGFSLPTQILREAFFLTFLFQTMQEEWIRHSWVPKAGLGCLIVSVVLGFILKTLAELGVSSKDVLATQPVAFRDNLRQLEEIEKKLDELKATPDHLAFAKKREQEIGELEKRLSALKKEQSTYKDFLKSLEFMERSFRIMKLVKFQLIQGALLAAGSALAVYAFCKVVWIM